MEHNTVIEWKHFPRYWPFVQGIHWSPVNSPHKDQWYRALVFSLICSWIYGWVNNKRLSKQRQCWWFDAPSRPLWRQCNGQAQLLAQHNRVWMFWFEVKSNVALYTKPPTHICTPYLKLWLFQIWPTRSPYLWWYQIEICFKVLCITST